MKQMLDFPLNGCRILVRADLNVPLASDGSVSDTTRIDRFAPTARKLLNAGAKIVICSHFGRPKGQRVADMSLELIRAPLAAAIGQDVNFISETTLPDIAPESPCILLENLRFDPGEEANSLAFAERLSRHCDAYINDAFSCSHRAHASTVGVTAFLPSAMGTSMEAELAALKAAVMSPQRPVAAIVGGAKVSTKAAVLQSLIGTMDDLIIGGAMANTFLAAQGFDIGASLCEPEAFDTVRETLAYAEETGCTLHLPKDVIVARDLAEGAWHKAVAINEIPTDMMALDLGPKTISHLLTVIGKARTLLWNGPLGAMETQPFGAGTFAVARHAATLTATGGLMSVAGGGDTVLALNMAGVMEELSYVSTAGGAFLEWLEGRSLPGVEALSVSTESISIT